MTPLSAGFLRSRGVCCGNGCTNCVFVPRHAKGSISIASEIYVRDTGTMAVKQGSYPGAPEQTKNLPR